MYINGHTALAYLLIGVGLLALRKRIRPEILLFVFIFANLPDALHFGFLRDVTHNTLGTFLFVAFWLWFFHRYKLIDGKHVPLLLFASGAHILGDCLFSGYYLTFPLNFAKYQLYAFNSYEHLLVGSILTLAFVPLFLAFDFKRLRGFIQEEKRKFMELFELRRVYNPDLFPFYLFVAFYLLALAQLVLFIIANVDSLASLTWFVWLFLVALVAFLAALTAVWIGRPSPLSRRDGVDADSPV